MMPSRLKRAAWSLDTPVGLATMFAAALVLRVAIAPHMGFYGDLNFFRRLSSELRSVGLHAFYKIDTTVDYPPGYPYLLWIVGKVSASPSFLLLKLPTIIADLALAWIIGMFAYRLAPVEVTERTPVRALAIAGVLFNPAVFLLSAGWGQVDAIPVVFMIASFLLLFTGPKTFRREIASAVLFGIAFSTKPQTTLAFPVIAYALYQRYFHRKQKHDVSTGIGKTIALGTAAIAVWIVLGVPFEVGPIAQLHILQRASGLYPVTSANAFNFWGMFGFWIPDAYVKPVTEPVGNVGLPIPTVLGIPAARIGLLLFALAAASVVLRVHGEIKRGANEALVLFVGSALLALLGYTFLTRMHERYMFVGLMCLSPLVFILPFRVAYATLSPLFLLSLWYPYAESNTRLQVRPLAYQPWFNWIDGGFVEQAWQKKMWSGVVTIIVVALAVGCWRWVRRLNRVAP